MFFMQIIRRFGLPVLALLFIMLTGLLSSRTALAQIQTRKVFTGPHPKLVVLVVVDQLKADYLATLASELTASPAEHGLVFFQSNAAYFPTARYQTAFNMTAPGHTTLVTGAYANRHGIFANRVFDLGAGKTLETVIDDRYPDTDSDGMALTPRETTLQDGSKKIIPPVGHSPYRLTAATLGDELKLRHGDKSKVVSLSAKERSAILMGGFKPDAVLWLNKGLQWVTSTFYSKIAPSEFGFAPWIRTINQQLKERREQIFTWNQGTANVDAYGDRPGADNDDPRVLALGKQLPSQVPMDQLADSPMGITTTVDMALAALQHMDLGADDRATDFLAVSFSAFDYVGHSYGPHSPFMASMLLEVDRSVSRLYEGIQKKLGSDFVMVVTSDHGIAPTRAWAKSQGLPAGWIPSNPKTFVPDKVTEQLNKGLEDKFGSPAEKHPWIADVFPYGLYFSATAQAHEKFPEVLRTTRELLKAQSWVLETFTCDELRNGGGPLSIERQVAINGSSLSCGPDIMFIAKPFHMVSRTGTDHFTPYAYDNTVPLMILGPSITHGEYPELIDIASLAPTLAYMMGLQGPTNSTAPLLPIFGK